MSDILLVTKALKRAVELVLENKKDGKTFVFFLHKRYQPYEVSVAKKIQVNVESLQLSVRQLEFHYHSED